jgi:nicotinate-nucleotide adenylyltransferase
MTRIGIFGGTFDPIHFGHLRVAEEVRERHRLDVVTFVPNRVPPHKPGLRPAPGVARLEMIRLAVRGHRAFAVSDLELRRRGPSYTIDTLAHFRHLHGDDAELVFILGTDAFAEIGSWRKPDELFTRADFVVMTRPGTRMPDPAAVLPARLAALFRRSKGPDGAAIWRHASGHAIRPTPVTALDISASDIRARVARGESIRFLTPDPVVRYSRRAGLYR